MTAEQDTPNQSRSPEDSESSGGLSRRVLLGGAGAVGAVGVLAACGTSTDADQASSSPNAETDASVDVPESSVVLAAVADVPEGGGIRVPERELVITQPEPGEFRAFSETCPHAGCAVSEITATDIVCPCHGSRFSAKTGDVVQGPAITGLHVIEVEVLGDQIVTSVS